MYRNIVPYLQAQNQKDSVGPGMWQQPPEQRQSTYRNSDFLNETIGEVVFSPTRALPSTRPQEPLSQEDYRSRGQVKARLPKAAESERRSSTASLDARVAIPRVPPSLTQSPRPVFQQPGLRGQGASLMSTNRQ